MDCPQQKCLIHLLRDINESVLKNPFNDEMKRIAQAFSDVLKPIVETIDRFGLKAWHLRKHKLNVARFYRFMLRTDFRSEIAEGYKKRFLKNRDKLFTFLDYDGVPWNNNNAEHAIKSFARIRRNVGANGTAKGIQEYLILLSIYETCNYRGIDFLKFLRSEARGIDAFAHWS